MVAICGCGACGRDDPYEEWGGMSKEEWLKQYREKQDAEDRKEAENTAGAGRKKRLQPKSPAVKQKPVFAGSYLKNGYVEGRAGDEAGRRRLLGRIGQDPKRREPPPLPAPPESIADWTDRDYVAARMTGDPALLQALAHLETQRVGDAQAAELLVKLLRPLAGYLDQPASIPRSRRSLRSRESDELIELTVAALGANGTELAGRTLRRLIVGEFETEDDRTAALASVQALVENPCPEHEEILFQILTAPEEIRAPGRGDVAPERLRKLAFELLRSVATSRFRLRVAQWMVDPATPPESRDELGELADRLHPEGLEANVFLLLHDRTPPAGKMELLEQLIPLSSRALGQALQIPDPPGAETADPEWYRRVIGELWGADFCRFLAGALEQTGSFEEKEDVVPVVLAGTVPADSVRAALYQTLRAQWTEGPAELASAGPPDELVCDPGLVVLVQTLVHEHIQATKRSLTTSRSRRLVSANRLSQLKAAHEAWEGELGETKDAWLAYLDELLSKTCERLLAASVRRREGGVGEVLPGDSLPGLSTFPIDLHDDARIVAAYHLDWTGRLDEAAPPVHADPMEVHYVRIEETTRARRMGGFYRRRLPSCEEREIEDGIALESLQSIPDSRRRRSLTVRIIRAIPEIPRLPDQDEPLIVEILCIEMNDPADPRWKTARLTES